MKVSDRSTVAWTVLVGLGVGGEVPVTEGLDDPVTDGDWLLVTDGGDDSSTVGLADADTDGGWLHGLPS